VTTTVHLSSDIEATVGIWEATPSPQQTRDERNDVSQAYISSSGSDAYELKASAALKAISLVLLVAQVLIFIGVGLGYYTIVQSLMSTVGPEAGTPFQYTGNIDETTGAFSGTLAISLRNPGMLEVLAHVSIKFNSQDGAILYQTSGDRRVAAAASDTMELPLSLSGADAQRISVVVLGLKFTTLFDLLSFSIDVPVPTQMGGGPPGE